ncbi:MAG: hypothetical protein P1P82_09865 [Bacteroidales bacterium]|nr:hypothetical protein [Bacteroidales bacterium]
MTNSRDHEAHKSCEKDIPGALPRHRETSGFTTLDKELIRGTPGEPLNGTRRCPGSVNRQKARILRRKKMKIISSVF